MQFKNFGVVLLLFAVLLITSWLNPSFLSEENVKSIIRWTSLFGFISLGVALVIMTGGIDLSIGSVVALSGVCMLLLLNQHYVDTQRPVHIKKVEKIAEKGQQIPRVVLDATDQLVRTDDQLRTKTAFGTEIQGTIVRVESDPDGIAVVLREPGTNFAVNTDVQLWQFHKTSMWLVVPLVLIGSALLGLMHGLLITKVGIQPFVVTLCGLLGYRGICRVLANEQPLGLGSTMVSVKELVNGIAFSFPVPGLPYINSGRWHSVVWDTKANAPLLDSAGQTQSVAMFAWVDVPVTAVLLAIISIALWFAINRSIFGRYLLALGNNVQAAKFSGISTDRIIISTYVICSLMAGLTGILLAFDLNMIGPSQTGNIFELYAIAAAVIGGCSLRGGVGSIVGVIIGTAVMRSLFMSIGSLGIKPAWEFVIISAALFSAVLTDEIIRIVGNRRRLRSQAKLAKQ